MHDHLPYLTPDEWFQSYQISVVDIRQIVDWAYILHYGEKSLRSGNTILLEGKLMNTELAMRP